MSILVHLEAIVSLFTALQLFISQSVLALKCSSLPLLYILAIATVNLQSHKDCLKIIVELDTNRKPIDYVSKLLL